MVIAKMASPVGDSMSGLKGCKNEDNDHQIPKELILVHSTARTVE